MPRISVPVKAIVATERKSDFSFQKATPPVIWRAGINILKGGTAMTEPTKNDAPAVHPADRHHRQIAAELNIAVAQVSATALLLGEGATVPFISRYRKEATGSLDEVAVTAVRDRLAQLAELDKRREAILKSLAERDLLTEELQGRIGAAETLAVLEDIYLPFRPKRRTRATVAREKGLEPLAQRSLPRRRRSNRSRRPPPSSIRKRGSPHRRRPSPGPATSSPNG